MRPERRGRLLALLSVVAVAIAVHGNSLGNGYALDDVAIVENNEQVHGLDRIGDALDGYYWPTGHSGRGLYRPFTLATYTVDWELGDGDPFPFHLGNVLLHAAVTGLLFVLLLRLGAGTAAGWAGAMLFAVHPVHVEAVANIVGRAELLVALFVLASTLLYLRRPRPGWGTGLAIAILYFLALASKEHAIMLPALLVGLDLLERRSPGAAARAALASWRVYLPMAAALAVYFASRRAAIGMLLGAVVPPWYWGLEPSARVLTAIRVWPEYLRLMVAPIDLVPDYGPGVIVPETRLTAPLVLLGLLTGVVIALIAWRARRRLPLVSGGIAWFALTVLPVTGLLFPVGIILAERTLYLPSVGFAMAVAAISAWVLARPRLRRPAAALFVLILAGAALRTWTANTIWRDSDAVIEHLLATHPTNFRAQWALGVGLREKGDTVGALEHLELASRMVPGYYNVRTDFGQLLAATGDLDQAVAQFDTALQVFPTGRLARTFHIQALLSAGRPDAAVHSAEQALRAYPRNADLHAMHARALGRAGRYEAAVRARRRAIDLDADGAAWAEWGHLAGMAFLAGDSAATEDALAHARDRAPSDIRVPTLPGLDSMITRGGRETIPLW